MATGNDSTRVETQVSPLKVAFRAEGDFVIAYVAATAGEWRMEIGRILRRVCDERKNLWLEFKDTMREAGFHIIKEATGSEIVGHEEFPPEMLEGSRTDT